MVSILQYVGVVWRLRTDGNALHLVYYSEWEWEEDVAHWWIGECSVL